MCVLGEEYFFGWIQPGGVRVHKKPQIAEDRAVCRSKEVNVALGCNGPDEVIFQHLLLRRGGRTPPSVFLVASALVIQGAASPVTGLFSTLGSHLGADTRELKFWVFKRKECFWISQFRVSSSNSGLSESWSLGEC